MKPPTRPGAVSRAMLAPLVALAALAACRPAAAAGPAAAELLPADAVGYASIADLPDFLERWDKTQIGQLFDLPEMEPFLERLRDQATARDGKIEDRLGVTFDELGDAASGEVAFGLLPQPDGAERAVVVAIADVAGRQKQAMLVIEKIAARLEENGATIQDAAPGLTVYSVPYRDESPRTVAYFLAGDRFVACSGAAAAERLLGRLSGRPDSSDALAGAAGFGATLGKADAALGRGVEPTVTWWLEPFAYADAARTLDAASAKPEDGGEGSSEGSRKDPVKILRQEGFDGVVGLGGRVVLAVDERRDVLHATAVYAPPIEGTAGKPARERHTGALGALETPNTSDLDVEAWAPRAVASYKTLNLDIQNLFDNVGSLVDAFIYKNAFKNTLEAFEKDPYGPKINLRDEVVAHLGQRVTVLTDYSTPITVDCERYLFVVGVTDEAALREPLDKWMESDGAERKDLTTPAGEEIYYWEIVPADDAADLDSLDDGLLPGDDPGDDDVLLRVDDEADERVLRRAAVCLHDGTLVVGSDVQFVRQALFGVSPGESLASDPELARTTAELDRVAPRERAGWTFNRTDQTFQATYELLRTNQMPKAQTFFGRLLNRFLTTAEEREAHLLREQKIDGSPLPDYSVVRPYLGPSARATRSSDDGWVVVGVVLRTEARTD